MRRRCGRDWEGVQEKAEKILQVTDTCSPDRKGRRYAGFGAFGLMLASGSSMCPTSAKSFASSPCPSPNLRIHLQIFQKTRHGMYKLAPTSSKSCQPKCQNVSTQENSIA